MFTGFRVNVYEITRYAHP